MRSYIITTDGSYSSATKLGGWAYVLESEGMGDVVGYGPGGKGFDGNHGGSNAMELVAVLNGLSNVPRRSSVVVRTDSTYVIGGVERIDYQRGSKWERLRHLLRSRTVTFIKVGGGGDDKHAIAHRLAGYARRLPRFTY